MLISEQTLDKLLEFHPEDKQKLIKNQLKIMEQFILNNKDEYLKEKEYSKAIDSILELIMKGTLAKGD